MNTPIIVERTTPDGLSAERWSLRYMEYENTIQLDSYRIFTRPTKRDKWKDVRWYTRIMQRDNKILLVDVPFDEWVIAQVREQLLERARTMPIAKGDA